MKFSNNFFSNQLRNWSLVFLSIVIILIFYFLFYTSEDPHWGSGYWDQWVIFHFHINHHWAAIIVKSLRKTLHFTGYGCIGLILWLYFYLWHLNKPLIWGWLGVLLIAILDEYTQSLTTFRFGKPADVLLDLTGAVVITGIVKIFVK